MLLAQWLGSPGGSWGSPQMSSREDKLREVMHYIDQQYVDEVNADSLLEQTISGLLDKLDPHSSYIPSELAAQSDEVMRGSFEGIGIEFRLVRDSLTVIQTIAGGPSEKAGIRAGDRILAAGATELFGSGISTRQVIQELKGPAGSRVMLNVYRPTEGKTHLVDLKRASIDVKSVPVHFMVDEETGYLRLTRFSQKAAGEVRQVLRELQERGARKMILDLRGNPGGLLEAARKVADEFLPKGRLIVYTENRQGDHRELHASGRGLFIHGPLAILINGGSASASEIVAGAVQDNDRGWIVGQRSYGKGLVQEEMTLRDGSRLRLTTRRYYTPSGRSIQKQRDTSAVEEEDLWRSEAFDSNAANPVFRTSGGRPLQGGGGIQPDVNVLSDTSRQAAVAYHLALVTRLDERAFNYVDRHRRRFARLSRTAFMRDFVLDQELYDHFFGEISERLKKQSPGVQEALQARARAALARYIYGPGAFQEAYAPYDQELVKALELLRENPRVSLSGT